MSSNNLRPAPSPRRESRSPFELAGGGGGARELSRHHSQVSPGAQKYSFMTAISQLEQFKSANEEIFLKRLKDTDSEIGLLQAKLKATFNDLDGKLNRVIQKHELDYNQAYTIMLKRKEGDLQLLMDRVRDKIAQDMFKDEKIKKLEQQIAFIRTEAIRLDKSCKALRDETAKYRSQLDVMDTDNSFLKEQVLDLNKQNKALKFALNRLQDQYGELKESVEDSAQVKQEITKRTDLIDSLLKTENLDLATTIDEINLSTKVDTPLRTIPFKRGSLHTVGSTEQLTQKAASAVFQTLVPEDQSVQLKAYSVQEDAFGRRLSVATEEPVPVPSLPQETERRKEAAPQPSKRLYKEGGIGQSPSISQLRRETEVGTAKHSVVGATENMKFKAVVKMLLDAQVTREELEEELSHFVNNMERRMNERVDKLLERVEIEKRKVAQLKVKVPAAQAASVGEFEGLFLDCVETVRREVGKRKLKGEMLNKRVFMSQLKATHRSVAEHSATALVKDHSFMEKMARVEELTATDRMKVLDLFVNNEKVVGRVFEMLFPSRPSPGKSGVMMGSTMPKQKIPSKGLLLDDLTAFLEMPPEPQTASKPQFQNPKLSSSIEHHQHAAPTGRSVHASPLMAAGDGMVSGARRNLRGLAQSVNRSFAVVSQSTPAGEKGVGTTQKSVSLGNTLLDLEAVGHELQRKRIKPNVFLKSGLIAAMANHRRSMSKQDPKPPSLFSQ